MQKDPFNIRILDPDKFIESRGCLPVTSYSMYEPSTSKFHPEGLYSELIFGQVGSSTRIVNRGYINLKTKVMSPHLFKQILSLKKTLFTPILEGTSYAYFDEESKMFVKTTPDDPKGDTGFAFFMSKIKDVQFVDTGSVTTKNKIDLIAKYQDELFMNKMLVIAAGLRDVKIKNGRPTSEDINKLYLHLLALANSMPEFETEDPIYDSIRYQIQLKVVEIYDYLRNIMDDKHGFGQGRYSSRDVAYSNRNVITGTVISDMETPDNDTMPSIDDLIVPLFQGIKGAAPSVAHHLRVFFGEFLSDQSSTAYLIDPDTYELTVCEVDSEDLRKFTSIEGMNKIINDFRDANIHFNPVTVKATGPDGKTKQYIVTLVYDTGDTIQYLRNKDEFKEALAKRHRYRTDFDKLWVIDRLSLNPRDFFIEGSGACYSYGLDVDTVDIDLVLRPSAFERLSKIGGAEFDEFGDFELMIDGTEAHCKMNVYNIKSDADFDKKYNDECITIGNYRFISPEVMLARYLKINRIKDKRKIKELQSIVFDETKMRPMTYVELIYTRGYICLHKRYCAAVRYPVNCIQSLSIFKVHLMSTTPSRRVILKTKDSDEPYLEFPEYPQIGSPVRVSMSAHPSSLELFNGDHDGDTMSLHIFLSDEANKEAEEYTQSTSSMLNGNGDLLYGLTSSKAGHIDIALAYLTYHQLSH